MQAPVNSMSMLKPIKTETDYQKALDQLDLLFDSKEGTPEGDQAEILAILIEHYEAQHYPIDPPDPIEAIKIRMEEQGIRQQDLVGLIGGKSRVSEVLNRKKRLTVKMIRILSEKLEISPAILIQDYPLTRELQETQPASTAR